MEEKMTVNMKAEYLYDFMLYHTYSQLPGFLTNVLGFAIAIMGVVMMVQEKAHGIQLAFYFIAAAVFIGYTPLLLKYRAKKQMELNAEYQIPWEYTFHEKDGITVVHGDTVEVYPWSKLEKLVTAPKTMGIYYGKDVALILPKIDFGERFIPIIQMIMRNLSMQKVRLRK